MMRKMLLIALLPVSPAFAQLHTCEEDALPPPISALNREIADTRSWLALPHNAERTISPMRFSTIGEQEQLQVGRDYHKPGDLLKIPDAHNGAQPGLNNQHFTNVSFNLEGIIYNELDCYVIHDRYQIAPENELPGNFVYDNTYFVYKDASGATVAEVIYIQCSIGNITTEKRIVLKGSPVRFVSSLTVAPNPARGDIKVSFQAMEQGSYTLSISNMEGKVISTLMYRKTLDKGTHTFDYTLDLQPGLYVLSVSPGKATPVSQKLIIQ